MKSELPKWVTRSNNNLLSEHLLYPIVTINSLPRLTCDQIVQVTVISNAMTMDNSPRA